LPAMQSTRHVRKIASSFIAGKPPPTVFAARQRYVEDVVAPPALDSIHSANFVSIPLAMFCIDADR